MSTNLALVVSASAMVGCGVYLLLERSLTRVLVGIVLMANGVNVALLLAGGPAGEEPLAGESDPAAMSDPLPQALALTAIVITLGTAAFILAMAYRSWQLTGHDDVQDDVEDRAVRHRAREDQTSGAYGISEVAGPAESEREPDDVKAEERGA